MKREFLWIAVYALALGIAALGGTVLIMIFDGMLTQGPDLVK